MLTITPALILALWASGIAAFTALVAWWRVVGPGYVWLNVAIVVPVGGGAALLGAAGVTWIGVVAAVAAATMARDGQKSAIALAVAAVGIGTGALVDSPGVLLAVGVLFIGAITAEMILGHWYLIDPTLPRWSLRRLDMYAGVGLIGEVILVAASGGFGWDAGDAVLGYAYIALVLMTGLLIVGVWYSLAEPSYTGVMAATGLSYLGVLTAFGVLVLGRQLLLPVLG